MEIRIHVFFPLLLLVCMGLSGGDGLMRGIGTFVVLCLAVLVREIARLIAAAWLGLRLRAVLLLPIGGFFAYANTESQEISNSGAGQWAMALAGPVANLLAALVLTLTVTGAAGDVQLLAGPLVGPAHLVRAMIWMQLGLGILHLLPAYPLDGGRLIRGNFARQHGLLLTGRAASLVGQILALAAMVGGMAIHAPWLIIAGFFIMIGGQIEDQGVFFQSVVDTVRMREVMLTDFAILSPSDTLADALTRCVHSLQDEFPVAREAELVGIVSRQRILEALHSEGNGYVQAIMSRTFQVARPDDTLGTTIRRLTAGRGLSLIPITEGGRVLGVVNLQNLMTAMSLLAEQRRIERRQEQD